MAREPVRERHCVEFVAGVVVGLLLAAPARPDAGWTGYGKVEELRIDQFTRIEARLDPSFNPTDCQSKEWFYRSSINGSELMYHTLLEAVSTNKRVRVYVTGVCDIKDFSEISSVSVVP